MTGSDPKLLGPRVKELRRAEGMSQGDLAVAVGRSESWVSQVERGVQPVERLSVLQALADALNVPVRELRPDAAPAERAEPEEAHASNDLDGLRVALTGTRLWAACSVSRHPDRSRLSLSSVTRWTWPGH